MLPRTMCGTGMSVVAAVVMLGCGKEAATGPGGTQPTSDLASQIPLYSGSIGLVVDTRDIFKEGYRPATAEIDFTGQSAFNKTLSIDSVTDVATLVIQNDSLSAAQKTAFASGIATTIIIRDSSKTELGRLADVLPVDNSNRPVSIATPLPPLPMTPVLGRSGTAYLLQREGGSDVVTRATVAVDFGSYFFQLYAEAPYQATQPAQRFTLTQLADSTYLVGHVAAPDSSWCVSSTAPPGYDHYVNLLHFDADTTSPFPFCSVFHAHVVLEQDPDGWMRLKVTNFCPAPNGDDHCVPTNSGQAYVAWLPGVGLYLGTGIKPLPRDSASRFRLISDDIDWTISDEGSSFDQPIIPPAHLDFAYLGTLTNCSAATLTETVGDNITQSTTTTFTTLESLQMFAGYSLTLGAKFSASAKAKIGPLGEVTFGAEVSVQQQFSANVTVKHDNTTSTATTSTVAVSRSRQLQLPPSSAVIVADYVKKIDNVTQPFTQTYRLRGAHHSNGAPLSGPEIVTQLRFNQFEGVITRIGADYVEFTIRGEVQVDQFLLAETLVANNPNACK